MGLTGEIKKKKRKKKFKKKFYSKRIFKLIKIFLEFLNISGANPRNKFNCPRIFKKSKKVAK